MKAKGHSLWLMPIGDAYDKLLGLIKRLAQEYKTPLFVPHVTLLGETMQSDNDVLKRAEQLVSGQKPFPVTLRTVDYQDFYFRSLFVRADRTEPLLSLYNRAKDIFEMQDIPFYMPHLSLMYGNFPRLVKEKIISGIGSDQLTEFTANSVYLFKTDGEANTWCRVKEFPLR
jgi:2'-5' RNA ligase